MAVEVPDWLQGVWSRDWIRRAPEAGGELGPEDSNVEVMYVQTPWAFVDVRRPKDIACGDVDVMAFGGISSVKPPNSESGPSVRGIVSWHACLNFEPAKLDPVGAWAAVEAGCPRATEDIGIFSVADEDNQVWMEEDSERTLQERWVR